MKSKKTKIIAFDWSPNVGKTTLMLWLDKNRADDHIAKNWLRNTLEEKWMKDIKYFLETARTNKNEKIRDFEWLPQFHEAILQDEAERLYELIDNVKDSTRDILLVDRSFMWHFSFILNSYLSGKYVDHKILSKLWKGLDEFLRNDANKIYPFIQQRYFDAYKIDLPNIESLYDIVVVWTHSMKEKATLKDYQHYKPDQIAHYILQLIKVYWEETKKIEFTNSRIVKRDKLFSEIISSL